MAIGEITVREELELPRWRRYYALTKPKVVLLIAFTALVGMLLAINGPVPLDTLLAGMAGIALAAGSGAALNHVVDRRIDAVMERTRDRPLPSGELETRSALSFALALGAIAMALLFFLVNPLTAGLTFAALIGYAVIYTVFLKRTTPQNIVWGGAAGAAPPLLGWSAVTGDVGLEPLLLMIIIFIWTPAHFWPLAIARRHEYARAGIPMLPNTHGVAFTKEQVLLYTLMLVAVSLMPFISHMSGLIYLAGAVPLGLGFLYRAWTFYRSADERLAMPTFGYSIFYLSLLFAFLLVDHYLTPMGA